MTRGVIVFALLLAANLSAQTASRAIGADRALATLMLVSSTERSAVVRFGDGPLEKVAIGDTLGKEQGVVRTITGTRMVLDLAFSNADGDANRAQMVFTKGQRGGKRYAVRPDAPALPGGRLEVGEPASQGAPR
jgi:hypothetical protein